MIFEDSKGRVYAWNSLPSFIVNSKYVASFKRSLVPVNLSKFLVYCLGLLVVQSVILHVNLILVSH